MAEDAKEKFLYRVPEVAAAIGCGTRLVWHYIATGELRVTRLGKRTLVHKDALAKFCARDHAGMRS
jgi:excisionase family DNA binding protein